MVGSVTIFSHSENWWKVKAVEGKGRGAGRGAGRGEGDRAWGGGQDVGRGGGQAVGGGGPLPSAQLALTGSGMDSILLPVNLQAKVVHSAVGQQPIDGQLQQQGWQGLGPGCRTRQSEVSWAQGCQAAIWGQSRGHPEVLGAGHPLGGGRAEGGRLSGTG